MAKKVLVLSTSLRNKSNSEMLAEAFKKGAEASGNTVEMVSLKDKSIAFCSGCLACQKIGRCVIQDDALAIADQMEKAEVIVWATPIYYYEMSGQMKTLIDRTNSLFPSDYAFRDIYMLSAAAEDGEGVDEGAVHGLNGWIACYEKARLKGTVFAGGVNEGGEIDSHPALKKAYEMGKSIQ
ncbi:flavodoxin family protein [Clostridium sp. AM58-1XD]|uniref:flavodoxin family protein n=1 Tax=Clostridium sp. AM58-1XD TaxID=2292307 RepID=UPI000E4B008E|nr:flavodoxin family protein [Clostridium sp. AM58-1XD]RGZ01760.1 flavodoxin family protein [Clostridium sp. AM58-1XD]